MGGGGEVGGMEIEEGRIEREREYARVCVWR